MFLTTFVLNEHIREECMQFVAVLAGGGVDDDGLVSTVAVDFSHAEATPFQTPPGLRGAQVYKQPIAFDFVHAPPPLSYCHCRTRQML
jgi:hypothetical protein